MAFGTTFKEPLQSISKGKISMVDQTAEIDARIRNYEGNDLIGYESSGGTWYGPHPSKIKERLAANRGQADQSAFVSQDMES